VREVDAQVAAQHGVVVFVLAGRCDAVDVASIAATDGH
jgi:hypothetical protein